MTDTTSKLISIPTLQQQLLGLDTSALIDCDAYQLHHQVSDDWYRLKDDAAKQGFELSVASAYRSYERQLSIWNSKASGARQVLDENELPLKSDAMSDEDKLFAILRWSALPGASRHHWGTDIDVYDAAALPDNYQLRLTLAETTPGGIFSPLHQWLDKQITAGKSYGFYRPYSQSLEKGEIGVACEPWHLSHRQVSSQYEQLLNKQLLIDHYAQADNLALRQAILDHFDRIYHAFISPSSLVIK